MQSPAVPRPTVWLRLQPGLMDHVIGWFLRGRQWASPLSDDPHGVPTVAGSSMVRWVDPLLVPTHSLVHSHPARGGTGYRGTPVGSTNMVTVEGPVRTRIGRMKRQTGCGLPATDEPPSVCTFSTPCRIEDQDLICAGGRRIAITLQLTSLLIREARPARPGVHGRTPVACDGVRSALLYTRRALTARPESGPVARLVLSSPLSSPARRSVPRRLESAPSARNRPATWCRHRASPYR